MRSVSKFAPNTIALRTGMGHAMAPYIVRRRLLGCALLDCSGPARVSSRGAEFGQKWT
jgi:hypothetical protein